MEICFSGEFLERYRIDSVLGEGGMGIVYRAIQTSLGRAVAVKFLSLELATEEFLVRFRTEAQLAAKVFHSNLVAVIECGQMGSVPYIVFELVDGPNLRLYKNQRGGRLPQSEVLDFVRQTADGLACAHLAGIIHRDIKPENLLIAPNRVVKVADFGLAKGSSGGSGPKTRTGLILGTPPYISPEQIQERVLTPATDLYSLGIVFYEMLAGTTPFVGPSPLEMLEQHVRVSPPSLPPDVPEPMAKLVLRLLAKEPAQRLKSMSALSLEIAQLQRAFCPPADDISLNRSRPVAITSAVTTDRTVATKSEPTQIVIPEAATTPTKRSCLPSRLRSWSCLWTGMVVVLLVLGFVSGRLRVTRNPAAAPSDSAHVWIAQPEALKSLWDDPPTVAMDNYGALVHKNPDLVRAQAIEIWNRFQSGREVEAFSAFGPWLGSSIDPTGVCDDLRLVNNLLLERALSVILFRIQTRRSLDDLALATQSTVVAIMLQASCLLCKNDLLGAWRSYDRLRRLLYELKTVPDEVQSLRPLLSLTWFGSQNPGWKKRFLSRAHAEVDDLANYLHGGRTGSLFGLGATIMVESCRALGRTTEARQYEPSIRLPWPNHERLQPILIQTLSETIKRIRQGDQASP